jgi:hypothetical protein
VDCRASSNRTLFCQGISSVIDYETQKEAVNEDGKLVSGLGNGPDDKVTYCFPVPEYLLGRFDKVRTFYEVTPLNSDKGWKVHVSATPASAEKVAAAVVPYLVHHDISFKIIPTVPTMRRFYATERYKERGNTSQIGKFITIYPRTIDESIKIVEDLDNILNNKGYKDGTFDAAFVIPPPADREKFVESDFMTCNGEFSVRSKCENGINGALSVRYVNSYEIDTVPGLRGGDGMKSRRIPVISETEFFNAFPSGENPFAAAGFHLSYCGVPLPISKGENLKDELRDYGFLVSEETVATSPANLLTKTLK